MVGSFRLCILAYIDLGQFGSLIAYGLGHIKSSIFASYQVSYLIRALFLDSQSNNT
jgi:hypothetical protein